jgi:hypothetical protein
VPKDGGDDLVQRGGGVHFQVCAAAQQRLDTLLQQQGPGDVPSSGDLEAVAGVARFRQASLRRSSLPVTMHPDAGPDLPYPPVGPNGG